MTALRVGIAIPQSFREPATSLDALRSFFRRAEDAGFDSLWVQEQLIGRDQSFEPLTMLAYAAACTTRVRLCSATFIAPVRNPVVFAKSLATVDQLSLGRLTVGLSLGDMRSLFPASGIPVEQRVPRLEELVEVVRRLWTEERVTFEGRFFQLIDAAMEPKPIQRPHPPIWFGGHAAAALDRAVRLGDGWIGAGGRSIAQFAESAADIRARAVAAGRTDFAIAKKLYLAIGETREAAFDGLRRWFDVHWGGDGAELARRVGVFGTPDECIETIVETWRLGADHIILNPVFDESDHLDRIATRVLPELAARMSMPRDSAAASPSGSSTRP
jgi:probable F420-dependent oxidoreductase